MAPLYKSMASLRISGEDLLPDTISNLLGCEPTMSWSKGQVVQAPQSDRIIVRRVGLWTLAATDYEPGNLAAQVDELLGKLNHDLNIWESLAEKYDIELFCSLFMQVSDEGLTLSSETLLALAQRRIALGLCVYAPKKELTDDAPCPCRSGKTYGVCCNEWRLESTSHKKY